MNSDNIRQLTSAMLPYAKVDDASSLSDVIVPIVIVMVVGAVGGVLLTHDFITTRIGMIAAAAIGAVFAGCLAATLIVLANENADGYEGHMTVTDVNAAGKMSTVTAVYDGQEYRTIMQNRAAERLAKCDRVRLIILDDSSDTQKQLGEYTVPSNGDRCLIVGEGR